MEDEEKQEGDTGMVLSGSITWPASTVLHGVLKSPLQGRLLILPSR